MLRTLPPKFDSRLIVLIDPSVARDRQGYASPANYTVRTVPARDTRSANWAAGTLRWCYVEEVPDIIASLDLAAGATAVDESAAEEMREKISQLESKIANAVASLQ